MDDINKIEWMTTEPTNHNEYRQYWDSREKALKYKGTRPEVYVYEVKRIA